TSSSSRVRSSTPASPALSAAMLIYIHTEEALADIERLYPARHYVLVDDKLRILDTVKWKDRVTTVFVRQGSYAHDPPKVVGVLRPADATVERIGDLLDRDLPALRTMLGPVHPA